MKSAPAADRTSVYTGSWDGYFYALDALTGKPRWTYFLGGSPDSAAPVLSNGKVYIQALGRYLDALDVETGASVWTFRVPEGYNLNATPAAGQGRVYMSTFLDANGTPSGSRLLALDHKTGQPLWEYRPGGGLTGPVIGRGRVYIGSTMDNYFSCVDAESGAPLWRTRIGGLIEESCPALYGNRAYVLVNDGYLYAFE